MTKIGSLALFVLLLTLFIAPNPPKTTAQYYQYVSSVPGLIWATWGGRFNETGNGVAADTSGNIFVVGSTNSFGAGKTDALLLKYNANASLLWARTWGGTNDDMGKAVVTDNISQGGVYIAGDTLSFSSTPAIFLVKFDLDGNLVWQRSWHGSVAEHLNGMVEDSVGHIFLTGETASFGAGNYDVFLLDVDSTGSLLWQRSWGGSGLDSGRGVALDPSGGVFVTGYTQSLGAKQAGILLSFNLTGDLIWQRAWNGSGTDLGSKIAVASNHDIYITGSTTSFGAGGFDASILKFSSTGSLIWAETWGGNLTDSGSGIAIDPRGRIAIDGYTSTPLSSGCCVPQNLTNAFTLNLNSSGGLTSVPILATPNTQLSSLNIDKAGNLIAAGSVSNFGSFWPEYFPSGDRTLKQANFSLQTPTYHIGTLSLQVGFPLGKVSNPQSVAETTNYAKPHVLIVKELLNPTNHTVKFAGPIAQFGPFRSPGNRTENVTDATYLAEMYQSEHNTGYLWNATGGLAITERNFSITPVTVTGSGTLTGTSYCCDFDQYQYRPHPALPQNISIVLMLVALPLLVFRRRVRRDDFRLSPIPPSGTFPHPHHTSA